MTANQLFLSAFTKGRPPRSPEYRDGVITHLRYRTLETTACVCPHKQGTAAFDAWWSGVDESWNILRMNKADRRGLAQNSPNA